jgi:hypothetical protein
MFENIENYIKRKINERQSHLILNEKCIEIGGYDSREFRGLLAHYLKTSIPTGFKIVLCHACGNNKCSNPNHLYWGTYSENLQDSKKHGTFKTPYENTVNKYGKKKASEMAKNAGSKGGKIGGGHNKLNEDTISKYKKYLVDSKPEEYGWIKRMSILSGLTHTGIRKFVNKYCKEIKTYSRK